MSNESSENVLMIQLYNASLPRRDKVDKIVVRIRRKKGDHFSAKLKTLRGYKISATGSSMGDVLKNLGRELVVFYPLEAGESLSIGEDGGFFIAKL